MKIYYLTMYYGSYEVMCISDDVNKGKREILKKLNRSFDCKHRLSDIDDCIDIIEMELNKGEVR